MRQRNKDVPAEILPLSRLKKAFIGVSIAYSIAYFVWRGIFSIDRTVHPIYSWSYFVFDALGFLNLLLFTSATWRIRNRTSKPAQKPYSIDVFVTTINEGTDMLRTTLEHVVGMDLPHETYLLDDGARPEMKALAEELGVHYLSRNTNTHAKAGNLNHGLRHSSGELIALFDADGIPRVDFLSRIAGYFDEPDVALVQTPNAFYNLDSFQHWEEDGGAGSWNDQSLWYDVILRGLDHGNGATWCGSGSMFRRSALEKIGGVPTESVTEDTLASLRFHQCGYGTVYHDEPVAFSLAPDSIKPYLVQRGRWALGSIQILRQNLFRILFSRTLPFSKKKSYLLPLYYFTAIQKLFYFTGTFIYLCLGISPVLEADRFVIPLTVYVILSTTTYILLARGTSRVFRGEIYFLHLIPVYLKAIAAGLLPFMKNHFKVTPKANEGRIPFRLRIFPAFVFILSLLSVGAGVYRYTAGDPMTLGVLFTMAAGFYYMMIALGAMQILAKEPVSYEVRHFFDFRPLRITALENGLPDHDPLAVSYMISAKSVHFLHHGSLKSGSAIALDLDLPVGCLALSGKITRCRTWQAREIDPLHLIEVEFEGLPAETASALSRYFFQHAAPRLFVKATRDVGEAIEKFVEAKEAKRALATRAAFAPVGIHAEPGSPEQQGVAIELSKNGAVLKSSNPLEAGTSIRLRFPWTGSTIQARVESSLEEPGPGARVYLIQTAFEQEAAKELYHLSKIHAILDSGGIRHRVN